MSERAKLADVVLATANPMLGQNVMMPGEPIISARDLGFWLRYSEVDLAQARHALREIERLLPTVECNGPRDCSGSARGCAECSVLTPAQIEIREIIERGGTG